MDDLEQKECEIRIRNIMNVEPAITGDIKTKLTREEGKRKTRRE